MVCNLFGDLVDCKWRGVLAPPVAQPHRCVFVTTAAELQPRDMRSLDQSFRRLSISLNISPVAFPFTLTSILQQTEAGNEAIFTSWRLTQLHPETKFVLPVCFFSSSRRSAINGKYLCRSAKGLFLCLTDAFRPRASIQLQLADLLVNIRPRQCYLVFLWFYLIIVYRPAINVDGKYI